jgi:hypothetical protein
MGSDECDGYRNDHGRGVPAFGLRAGLRQGGGNFYFNPFAALKRRSSTLGLLYHFRSDPSAAEGGWVEPALSHQPSALSQTKNLGRRSNLLCRCEGLESGV